MLELLKNFLFLYIWICLILYEIPSCEKISSLHDFWPRFLGTVIAYFLFPENFRVCVLVAFLET
jgi:hypothetical protein